MSESAREGREQAACGQWLARAGRAPCRTKDLSRRDTRDSLVGEPASFALELAAGPRIAARCAEVEAKGSPGVFPDRREALEVLPRRDRIDNRNPDLIPRSDPSRDQNSPTLQVDAGDRIEGVATGMRDLDHEPAKTLGRFVEVSLTRRFTIGLQ